jgi:hypothetical protein
LVFAKSPIPGVIDPPAVVTGVHITRLTPDGRKAPIDPRAPYGRSAAFSLTDRGLDELIATAQRLEGQAP